MRKIAIVGGGLMGAGIAQVFAVANYPVSIFEPLDAVRATVHQRIADGLTATGGDIAVASNVRTFTTLADAVGDADYVTEAAPEKLELKRSIFTDLVKLAPPDAILASNTSVIPITQIAEGIDTADRIVGTHWWNPAPLIPLVEVVQAERTAPEAVDATMALLTAIGKRPARVKKDLPGFVANRLQHALWREAIAMVADGICDAQTLDDCVKNSFGLRLAVLGPLENADLVGLDLTLDIHRTIIPELDRHAGPHEYLEKEVEQRHLGFKTGQGFRTWTDAQIAEVRAGLIRHLVAASRKTPQ